MTRILLVAFFILSSFSANVIGQAGSAPAGATQALKVEGEVLHPQKLGAEDLAKLPRHRVVAKTHDGSSASFEGVALVDILRLAGVEFGEKLHGKVLAQYLVVEGADGYRVVIALPELDPMFTDQVIILADRRDGKTLPAAEGPWRVIVPSEKRHERWVRQVVALRLGRA